ncbi:hypothetical protein [Priestia flexa]|uniref:hypothetical protein n=1 Tax=Priestia flexa TaxID=86664 RepID=UPI00047370C9|nr:hypothetical protein [Priestia flexa]
MGTRVLDAFSNRGNHEVGNLSSLKIRTLTNGALVVGNIDNFTAVELGFDADGERVAKQLSDVTKKTYLIASPERRYLGEELVDFYNAEGERARIVFFDEGFRFDTSAFSKNTGVTEIKNGQVAHFDPATKKYIISAADTPHADYATADKKFLVVSEESNLEYTCGKPLVRLEVQ